MYFQVEEITKICNGILLTRNNSMEIENFSIDTRTLKNGDMYIALKGENSNGNKYVEEALKKGAIGAIVDEDLDKQIIDNYNDKVIIKVENSIVAIQELAKYKRSLYNIPVVAVTGSVGKTSTKDIIASVLSTKFNVLKTEGNYNNHIGLPLTLLKLKKHTAVVIEMGMNHFGEIRLLTSIARPTIAVITNIGTSHIGNLGSRENILKAKLEILEGLSKEGKVVINNDNDLLNKWAKNEKKCEIITLGIKNKSNYMAYNICCSANNTKYNAYIENKKYEIEVPIVGKHFIYNSLFAIAIGKILDVDNEKIKEGILNFKLTNKRMDFKQIKNNVIVLADYYNASYDSMKAALEVIETYKEKRKIAVLGDMLELGEFSEKLHRDVGKEVLKNEIDILITVGELSKNIASEAQSLGMKEIYICRSNKEAIEILNKKIKQGDIILLKASNGMNFGEILEKIKE